MGSVLILTGPPGAGKSTVGDILARTAPLPAVHLHTDDFFDRFIKAGFVKPWLPEAQAQNETVTGAIAAAAFAYARGGYFVVVDGIVGPWFLDLYRRAAGTIALSYAVLRPADPHVSLARVQGRDERGLKDEAVIRDLYRQFSGLGALEAHVIESGAGAPESVAAELRARLRAGQLRLA